MLTMQALNLDADLTGHKAFGAREHRRLAHLSPNSAAIGVNGISPERRNGRRREFRGAKNRLRGAALGFASARAGFDQALTAWPVGLEREG
jgi:hypothetical protein